MHLVKAVMGLGIVALPHAVQAAGLWVGTIGLAFVGLFSLGSMHMIAECAQALSVKADSSYISYADAAELSCLFSGSEKIQSLSKIFR